MVWSDGPQTEARVVIPNEERPHFGYCGSDPEPHTLLSAYLSALEAEQ